MTVKQNLERGLGVDLKLLHVNMAVLSNPTPRSRPLERQQHLKGPSLLGPMMQEMTSR